MIKLDMMGNKTFNDDQIDRLLQTSIRTRVSQEDELKAARLSRGTPTASQQAFIDKVDAHIAACIANASQLRADSALLADTIRYEQAEARLAVAALDPNAVDEDGNAVYPLDENGVNAVIEADKGERLVAQAVVDNASFEVLSLSATRRGE